MPSNKNLNMTNSTETTYFITGGNRGIGFNLLKILSASSENIVIASIRGSTSLPKNKELKQLTEARDNIHIVQLDVAQEESINKLPEEIEKIPSFTGIDIFIANSGIADSYYTVLEAPREVWIDHYRTNVLGPILTLQKIYPLLMLKKTRKVFFISSAAGSITSLLPVPISAYGQSKAALNYTMRELSVELKSEEFTVAAFHPGMVSTDMGQAAMKKFTGEHDLSKVLKVITPEESASALVETFNKIVPENSGNFYNYDGSEAAF